MCMPLTRKRLLVDIFLTRRLSKSLAFWEFTNVNFESCHTLPNVSRFPQHKGTRGTVMPPITGYLLETVRFPFSSETLSWISSARNPPREKMAALPQYYANLTQPIKYSESHSFEMFVPVQTREGMRALVKFSCARNYGTCTSCHLFPSEDYSVRLLDPSRIQPLAIGQSRHP